MKRITALILFACLTVFALSGCKKDEEKDTLWYLVKTETQYNSDYKEEVKYFYNDEGKLSSKEYYENGVLSAEEVNRFDEIGVHNYTKKTEKDHSGVTESYFTRDTYGRVLTQKDIVSKGNETQQFESEFKYIDDYGSYTERTVDAVGVVGKAEYVFDEKGYLTKIVYLITGYTVNYFNTYDEKGRLTEQSDDLSEESIIRRFEYDENGNLKSESVFASDGKLLRSTDYYYSEQAPKAPVPPNE